MYIPLFNNGKPSLRYPEKRLSIAGKLQIDYELIDIHCFCIRIPSIRITSLILKKKLRIP